MRHLLLPLLMAISTQTNASNRFYCESHNFVLVLEVSGFEHVQHKLKINGLEVIAELFEGSWFIEEISCAAYGFDIVASHRQYGDPEKQTFNLPLKSNRGYQLIRANEQVDKVIRKSNAEVQS